VPRRDRDHPDALAPPPVLHDAPQARLLALGVQSLSDAELLAVLLGAREAGSDELAAARRAIDHLGGLAGALNAPCAQYESIAGLGPDGFARAQAALEIAKRALRQALQQAPVLDAPSRVRDFLRLQHGRTPHEVFTVLFLDSQHKLIASEDLFRGTLTQTSVYPREVVRRALLRNCAAVILSHNHPSGVAEPSRADEILTRELRSALRLVDIQVLDHIIVAAEGCVSFAERGLL
jgi:DNA repair protein RadC